MAKTKRKPAKRKASRRPNGAATAARTANPRGKKRTGARRYSTSARRTTAKRTHNRVTHHKRKATRSRSRRRYNGARIGNPISAGGVVKFAIAAGTAGAINAVINTVMNMLNLQLPQQGIIGLAAKLGVAYGIGALLPKTKIISQDTANVVAITIAAAAFTNWLTPMLDGLLAGFMPAAAAPATSGAQDIYSIPPGTYPNGYGPYPTQAQIAQRRAVTPTVMQKRPGMQDIYAVPQRTYPNGYGPYQQQSFAPGV